MEKFEFKAQIFKPKTGLSFQLNSTFKSFLIGLIWTHCEIVALLLLFSCKPQVREYNDTYEKIWSDQILSIEFSENDTVNFYTDTLSQSYSYKLVFVKNINFKKSKLLDVDSVLYKLLTPLNIDNTKFLVDFEVKEVDGKWLQIKNNNLYKQDFYWIAKEDVNIYTIKTWADYLIGYENIEPLHGNWSDILKASPSDNAPSISLTAINCSVVNSVVDDIWLEMRFDQLCENYSYKYQAFMKWKDNNGNLLIKL